MVTEAVKELELKILINLDWELHSITHFFTVVQIFRHNGILFSSD